MRRALAWTALLGVGVTSGQTDQNAAILEKARRVGLTYARHLPDFICTEVARRAGEWKGKDEWVPMNTVTLQLTYHNLKETYQILGRDGKPTKRRLDTLAGAFSQGEFGSTLRMIFDPESKTEFHWEHWDLSGVRGLAVFGYRVSAVNSHYGLVALTHEAIVGFHGEIAIDPESGRTMRWTALAEPPAHFPIASSETSMEYGMVDIGGTEYLLPVRAQSLSMERALEPDELLRLPPHQQDAAAHPVRYRNEIEFRSYRKFSADARITF
jgi:hypothetical protein